MKILVTGACGYKGTVLVPKLLKLGHHVLALDTQWFGNFLEKHDRLEVVRLDIINTDKIDLSNIDTVIHLASIANDPCSDLDPKLTWETSCLATMKLAEKAYASNVGQFIYASSGSVYGISDKEHVTEDVKLNPISEYNKTKMCAERILLSYSDKMDIQIIRPATVCGYSPRMRLDVAVNLLTMQALETGIIKVLGGNQIRPNIHIDDITDLYLFFLENRNLNGVYNAGFENISILDIAKLIQKKLHSQIVIEKSNDPRSYRLNSDKLLSTGFKPKRSVEIAINEICQLHKEKKLLNKDYFHNLKWMKKEILIEKSNKETG
jgi:nucleoside-diphosphate-sugar epimerase